MDNNFFQNQGNNRPQPDAGPHRPSSDFGSKDFAGYYQQRSKKVESFTLNMQTPESSKPMAFEQSKSSDVFSYSDRGEEKKQADFIELTKSMAQAKQTDIDDFYFGENGVLGRGVSDKSLTRATEHPQKEKSSFFHKSPSAERKQTSAPKPQGKKSPNKETKRAQPAQKEQDMFISERSKKPMPSETTQKRPVMDEMPAFSKQVPQKPSPPPAQGGEKPVQRPGRPMQGYDNRPVPEETFQQPSHSPGLHEKDPVPGDVKFSNILNEKTQASALKKPASTQPHSASSGASKSKSAASGQKAQKPPKSKYNIASKALAWVCCLLFIGCLTAAVSGIAISSIDDILAIHENEETKTVVIPDGADWKQVIDILSQEGLIHQKLICMGFAKFRNFDGYYNDDDEFVPTEYAGGVYYVESDDGLEAIMNSMKVGYGSSAETVSLSFPEGWSVQQIFDKLEKNEVCEAEKLYANLDIVAKQYDFYKNIPDSSTRYQRFEGYLYPDTYDFFIGENANSVLKKLFDNFEKRWVDDYAQRTSELGYTMDEVLTVASILQREGKNQEQMLTISSILHNRLNNPSSYPMLQCNSTLDYANKYIVPNVDSYYGQLYSTAYNTYSSEGLPPGPICNPGDDAIYAALYPEDTGYYYFCHDDDGHMYIASTYEQQRINYALALE